MRATLRLIHILAAWLLVASIVVQVFLAGSAIVNLGGSGDFSTHIEFGYTAVGLAALAVLLTAVVAGSPRRDIGIAFGLLVLYVVQTVLPSLRADLPAAAALHPVNAMLLFGLSVWYARRAGRLRAAGAERAAAPEPAAERDAATAEAS